MEPKGAGALQLRFEQMKKKLAKEGLFDDERKKPLPPYPACVAIVTSPMGAAIRDMISVLTARYPKVRVLLHPVAVQGEGAAEEIAKAIAEINLQRTDVDVMIVGRGGGSLEDLWAFNEEAVARAISGSRIPVVSAVGHETDFTIADFVADVRAATPTDAANRVVPDLRELMENLEQLERTIVRRPRELYQTCAQRVDELHERLAAALPRMVAERRGRLDLLARSAGFAAVESSAERHGDNVKHLAAAMDRLVRQRCTDGLQAVQAAAGRLEALSPLKVLGRGYSITQDAKGRALSDASKVKPGTEIRTRLAKGRLRSRVDESFADEEAGDTMSRP
jgi:exodeoxyribonuclease VII large subunit